MTYAPPADLVPPRYLLRERGAIWLLSIEIGGRTLRYSSRPVTIDGEHWRGGLPAVRVDQVLDMLSQEPAAPSVSVALPADLPVHEWVAAGHRLDRGIAELSWWVPDTPFGARHVVVSGRMIFGAYGGEREPLTGTIEPETQGEGAILGEAEAVYTEASVPPGVRVERSVGQPYPLIFGRPYERRVAPAPSSWPVTHAITSGYATELLPYQRDDTDEGTITLLVLCDGHAPVFEAITLAWEGCEDPDDDGSVLVERNDAFTAVFFLRDGNGRAVTVIDLAALESLSLITVAQQRAQRWFARWDDASGAATTSTGGVEVITTPIDPAFGDQVVGHVRPGDVYERAQLRVVSAFGGGRTLTVTLEPRAAGPLSVYSSAPMNTTGNQDSTLLPSRMRGGYGIRAALSGAGPGGEAYLVSTIRRAPRTADTTATLGGLLLYLAERSGQRIDQATWAALSSLLDVEVGGQLDATRPAWDILLRDVLPVAPVSLRASSRGIAPVLWRWWASPGEAVARLRVGYDGIVRLPDVRAARPDGEIQTSAIVRYGWSPRSNSFARFVGVGLDDVPAGPPIRRLRGSLGDTMDAAVSRRIYEQDRALRLDSRLIYSTETAAWWARWRLASEGWAHRLVEIEGRADLGGLALGSIVLLDDPSVSLGGALGLVVGRTLGDAKRVALTVALVDGVSRFPASSGPTADSGTPYRTGGPRPSPQGA